MYRHVAQEVCGTTCVPYGEYMIDLGKPFERLTMIDAVKKYSGVDFNEIKTLEEAKRGCQGFTTLSLRSVTSAAISSTCSLRLLLRNTSFSLHLLLITLLKYLAPYQEKA